MAKRLGVTWTGLDTLTDELHTLAPDLTAEADPLLLESLQAAKADVAAAYPVGATGNLRSGLTIEPVRGPNQAGANLVQRAPHGWIYEHGTKVRTNQQGANRGAMLGHPTFEPITAAHRRTAMTAVVNRLYAHGAARVTGDLEPPAKGNIR
jgi:hypothetical protein